MLSRQCVREGENSTNGKENPDKGAKEVVFLHVIIVLSSIDNRRRKCFDQWKEWGSEFYS